MILTLIRDTFTTAETLGKLYIDHVFVCDTLEPPVVPNARHPKGCIPQGWYNVSVLVSVKVIVSVLTVSRSRHRVCHFSR